MRLSKYIDRRPTTRAASRARRSRGSLAAHRAFVPMLAVWGAALLGLTIVVLPADAIARISVLTSTGSLGAMAKTAYAVIAALLGAGIAYAVAAALRDRALNADDSGALVTAVSSRRERVIDPASDLGSPSLDAPIEEAAFTEGDEDSSEDEDTAGTGLPRLQATSTARPQPTLGELSQRGYEIDPPEDRARNDGAEEGVITPRHYRNALIETCEAETCQAETCEAEICEAETCEAAAPDVEPAPPVEAPGEVDTPQEAASLLMVKAKRDGNTLPIGRPGTTGSWSLTQFTPPSPEAVPEPEAQPGPEPQDAQLPEAPRALDLAEFAQLPGRNAVWVEEAGDEAATEAQPGSQAEPVPPASALEKLRRKHPEELSLVEMIERFAGALHERQQADVARASHASSSRKAPSRDPALAEALKALSLFSERGFDQPGPAANEADLGETTRELRSALAKLQTLSGAA